MINQFYEKRLIENLIPFCFNFVDDPSHDDMMLSYQMFTTWTTVMAATMMCHKLLSSRSIYNLYLLLGDHIYSWSTSTIFSRFLPQLYHWLGCFAKDFPRWAQAAWFWSFRNGCYPSLATNWSGIRSIRTTRHCHKRIWVYLLFGFLVVHPCGTIRHTNNARFAAQESKSSSAFILRCSFVLAKLEYILYILN